MQIIGEWLRRLWYLLNRRRLQEALRQEMEAHRESMRQPARFGSTLRLGEEAGDVWGWAWLDGLARDTRHAALMLRRSPGFTIIAVSSLALGFALVAVTLSVVNAYLVRALPYGQADRLYHVRYAPPGPWEPRGMSALDWTAVGDVVEQPITASGETFYLSDGFAQSARGLRVGAGFVHGLAVRAVKGRTLEDGDWQAGSEPVAMMGYGLWRDRYASDPAIVGGYVRADAETAPGAAETFRIVGVLPSDFYFGRDSRSAVDLLMPLTARVTTYMVRLRTGVPAALAERRLTEAARAVSSGLPPDWTGVELESAHERYVADLRPVLVGVSVAAALVLAIVCANVAALTLLRTMRRQREIAVRAALGSGRLHLARMLALEAALLCMVALGAALTLAHLALRALAPVIEARLERPTPGGTDALAIDAHVVVALGVVAALVSVTLAFLPLLAPWQRRLGDVLRREGVSSTDGVSMRRVRSTLVALQVAGTLVLLVGGGLMVRSIVGMVRTDLGFEPERLVRARIALRSADYADADALHRFYERFTDRLSSATNAPVAFTSWPPFIELPALSVETEGVGGRASRAGVMRVAPAYFATVGARLRGGRDFTAAEVRGDEPVAIVSETLARRLWPGGAALGRLLSGVEPTPDGLTAGRWRTIVGVAADMRREYFDHDAADVYFPRSPASVGRFGSFYLRTDRATPALLQTVRAVAAEIDPHAIVDAPSEVSSQNRQLEGARFMAAVMTGVATVAAGLAVLGIYGVTAYTAQQRSREVAIRLALGATDGAIRRLFLKDCARLLAAGLGCGLIATISLAKVLEHQLYGVTARDVPTLTIASAFLAGAGTLAAWWPARRASLRSPVAVLKEGYPPSSP